MWRGDWRVPPSQRRRTLMAEFQNLQQLKFSSEEGRFDSEDLSARYEELSRQLGGDAPAAVDGTILLDPDILHMLCEALGAQPFSFASCCWQWSDAARTLQPNHDLWKEACMAASPLLAKRHSPETTWKQLLKQRRLADREPVCEAQDLQVVDCHLSFELIDATTNTVLRHDMRALTPDQFDADSDDLPGFEFEPLKVTLDERPNCVHLYALRLSMYLTCGSRMCCLVRNEALDMDDFDSWYVFDCHDTRLNVRLEFNGSSYGVDGYGVKEDDVADDDKADHLIGMDACIYRDEGGPPFVSLVGKLGADQRQWVDL